MSLDETGWGWRGVQLATILVYIFMFAPILVVVVLSFNASQFGGFPMTGLSLRWYEKLIGNEAVLRAFQTSMWIALVTSGVCTALGVMGALALVRYEFPGKTLVNTLIIAPVLVPETVLEVGLLLLIRFAQQPARSLSWCSAISCWRSPMSCWWCRPASSASSGSMRRPRCRSAPTGCRPSARSRCRC